MELKLKTGNGELLNELLKNWLKNSAEIAMDRIKRVLIMFSAQIQNEDEFIAALYGQNVGDKTPLELRENLTTAVLRVQHVIELACQKRRLKELVAALEWSGNETVLAEILKWAQKASTEANFEKETSVGEIATEPKANSLELSLEKLILSSGEVNDEHNKIASAKDQATGNSENKSGPSGANSSATKKQPVVPQEEHKQSGSNADRLAKLPINTASSVVNAGIEIVAAANVHDDFGYNNYYDPYLDELEYCGNNQDLFDFVEENYDDGYDQFDDAYCSVHDVYDNDSDTDQITY